MDKGTDHKGTDHKETDTKEICSICGGYLEDEFKHTLNCNHTFHYNCLFLTFKNLKNNNCPYCRGQNNLLPLVNGIRKVVPTIHELNNLEDFNYESKPCNAILKRGKNKGNECGRFCKLGYDKCRMHSK